LYEVVKSHKVVIALYVRQKFCLHSATIGYFSFPSTKG